MAWMIRPVLPAGSSFGGQLVYNMTNFEIDDNFKRSVESMRFDFSNKYVNKYTGFETIKHRIRNTDLNDVTLFLSITLVGNLERYLCQALVNLAKGCNGGGMEINFRDTWATSQQYRGRWMNAGNFVDNSELLCGGTMELACFEVQAI